MPTPGTPRRSRREQLARLAAELFAQKGFHNVSVNDIAAAAGVSGPAIYRHFRSKQAILVHLLCAGLEETAELVERGAWAIEPPRAVHRRGSDWRRSTRSSPRSSSGTRISASCGGGRGGI